MAADQLEDRHQYRQSRRVDRNDVLIGRIRGMSTIAERRERRSGVRPCHLRRKRLMDDELAGGPQISLADVAVRIGRRRDEESPLQPERDDRYDGEDDQQLGDAVDGCHAAKCSAATDIIALVRRQLHSVYFRRRDFGVITATTNA
jgi:hypothetical protein